MVNNKKQKNIKKEDYKKVIKKASDNEKNYYKPLSEDEKNERKGLG